ncbi:urea carboxylase/pyruvate carboxylase subunit B/propionyl-CoA carboxylase alpha chain [Albimonas donghaensis]|uniref:Urea carboxylase/pyruvate carboxylase subunit B/propionyl-CoA carboxylase alpha chain n=1 Tax=Albimonas donghaensis TaxID=356660 RepID=A0A1H2RT38_9RHOB|nr:acetyl-CoA carboxylase biotin carboxyl carrier protein subunit [Albimonas donghaensis]SDW22330.1 urea carboxylase/pyruvate carboxylase subunit B/propionyl-CoA carboxylase alpha chain [Albimonas donghaensis]
MDILTDTAGRVMELLKAPGDRVEAGETVMTVEAMKMEIPIAADAAGVITAIAVAVDQMVEEDQAVATLEPSR